LLDRIGPAFPRLRVSDVSNVSNVSGVSGVSFVSDVSQKHRCPAQNRNTRTFGRLPLNSWFRVFIVENGTKKRSNNLGYNALGVQFLEGLKKQFILFHVSAIPVRADKRWLIVIVIMSAIIAASVAPFTGNPISAGVLGLAATVIFFLSIFLHEYAHAAVAQIEGLRVIEIVLHPFGGITRFRHEPETPRAEFRIAIAGPAASFILAILFAMLATAATALNAQTLVLMAATLAIGNFILAVFNLFPGYPLDGGRVLRAYLWQSGKDLDEATILTGRCGKAIAWVMIIFGLFAFILRGDIFTGFWALLVGIFLWDSANSIIRDVRRQEKISVEAAMMLPISVAPEKTIHEFVDDTLSMHRQSAFPVAKDRRLLGMLLLEEMKAVARNDWRNTAISDVMRPVDSDHFVEVGTPLSEARELARTNGIGSVCVIDKSGALVGVVRR
ncbi:MAG: M50 family metallopeptidase, partial [Pyrinomonadaceae bacterium]